MVPPTPAVECLETIQCPTLVILGERDLEDFHDVTRILGERIHGATCTVTPGAGHMSNMEAPEAFNNTLLEFLARRRGADIAPAIRTKAGN